MNKVKYNEFSKLQFNPRYSFDSFVPGKSNVTAFQMVKSIVESPTRILNPIYIYGSTGVGKTHLLHAIGNYLLNKSKNICFRYESCEIFTEILVDEFTHRDLSSFIKIFQCNDYILIDDVQYLLLLEFTQEVFLEAIKAFVCSGKQIILTSDCPLQMLPNLKFDSFSKGTIIQIHELDMEAKLTFISNKVEENKVLISDDILSLIAGSSFSGGFQLEGILNRLIALASLKSVSITSEVVTEAFKPFLSAERKLTYYAKDSSCRNPLPGLIGKGSVGNKKGNKQGNRAPWRSI